MYLLVLAACGLFQTGIHFFIYSIAEIMLIILIQKLNKRKLIDNIPSAYKCVGELIVCRIFSTIAWSAIFTAANYIFTPKRDNGWEILDYWFPPEAVYELYDPLWHLTITLAVCLIITLAAFQFYIVKKKKVLYYAIIAATTLISFLILTRAGLPIYWH